MSFRKEDFSHPHKNGWNNVPFRECRLLSKAKPIGHPPSRIFEANALVPMLFCARPPRQKSNRLPCCNPHHKYENLRESGELLEMNFIEQLTADELLALLEEMTEMAILQKVDEKRFRLRKYSFIELLGKSADEIEKNITEALKKH